MPQCFGLTRAISLVALDLLVFICTSDVLALDLKPLVFRHDLDLPTTRPLNLAHRGSAGVCPENCIHSWNLALDQGADLVKTEVALTKDERLVCIGTVWLSRSTDIKQVRKFAERKRQGTVRNPDGPGLINITDWFVSDFTLEEIKSLRVIQAVRTRDLTYDRMFQISTLEEFLEWLESSEQTTGGAVEPLETAEIAHILATTLNSRRVRSNAQASAQSSASTTEVEGLPGEPLVIMSKNEAFLAELRLLTSLPRSLIVTEMPSLEAIKRWSRDGIYAIAPLKNLVFSETKPTNSRQKPKIIENTGLISNLQLYDFKIWPQLFMNEAEFLAADYLQDYRRELAEFYKLGVDGFFTDFPASMLDFLDDIYNCEQNNGGTGMEVHTGSGHSVLHLKISAA